MSRLKKKQNISGGYKPLVAASLAVALGVSVASAASANITTSDDVLTSIESGTTSGTDVSGLSITNNSTAKITATLTGETSIRGITTNDAANSVYGIYVKGDQDTSTIEIAGDFAITQAALPTNTATTPTGKIYIYANKGASAVSFTGGARIVAGTLPTGATPATMFGIYSALDGASYAFGSATGKTIFDAGTAANDTAGAAYTGMIINNNTTLAGNIDVIGQAGGTATAAGKNGGDTIGISIDATAKRTITANALILTVTGGDGSDGHTTTTDVKGIGGSATGLSITGTKGVDITGGAITLNLVAGSDGQGTDPADPKVKTLTAIDNKMTGATGILTFKAGSSLTVSDAAVSGVFGIYNAKNNVIYNFGSGEARTVFESITDSGIASAAGADATGINLVNSATFGGNLVFTSIAGQTGAAGTGDDGKKGGNATGIILADTKNLTLNNANITFTAITGGAGGATSDFTTYSGGNGGNAVGISLSSGSATISGNGAIVFTNIQKGLGSKKPSVRGSVRAGNGTDGNAQEAIQRFQHGSMERM